MFVVLGRGVSVLTLVVGVVCLVVFERYFAQVFVQVEVRGCVWRGFFLVIVLAYPLLL